MYNEMIPTGRRDEIHSKIQEIDAFIRNNFLFLDEIDEARIEFGIFSGYISEIGDKNTVYMTAEEHINRRNVEKGNLVTCGIQAEREGSDYIKVVEVYPGSSAELQGVLRDDIITFIDGRSVLEMGQDTAMRFLIGEENTRVEVTIQREGEVITHTLVRQAIEIISVESVIVSNIGFVRISTFSALTAAQFEAELQEFVQAGVRALIIDLRGNSSGVYAPALEIVNRLIGANTVAFRELRGGVRRDFLATDSTVAFDSDIPIVVLCDFGTNGAGELMAAALRSFGNAQIVGVNTAGNAYLQDTQELRDGSAIRVTVAKIVLTCGLEYANIGLIPDYLVEMSGETAYDLELLAGLENPQDTHDPQIARAFEIIDTVTVNVQ
jgi:carboxyl-terminal processing protease